MKNKNTVDLSNKSFLNKCYNIIEQIEDWFKKGDPPPKTHYKSLGIMLLLLFTGATLLVCFILAHFEIALTDFLPIPWPFLGLSIISLGPALYILFVAICSWRRVKGYGWWMIPYVEHFW